MSLIFFAGGEGSVAERLPAFSHDGDFASDMSDAAGTMWLDVAKRDWSEAMLDACQLTRDHMPALFEGSEITGALQPSVAERWNMPAVPVVAGGGDNAAGRSAWGWSRQDRPCSRSALPASILPSVTGIVAIPEAPYTASATRCRVNGI